MTLSIGTKVRVNATYLAGRTHVDDTVTEVRGKEGTVVGYCGSFTEVAPSDFDNPYWKVRFLFWEEELDVLEEAHPLPKEHINS